MKIPAIIALFLAVPLIAQTAKPITGKAPLCPADGCNHGTAVSTPKPSSPAPLTFISDCTKNPEACIAYFKPMPPPDMDVTELLAADGTHTVTISDPSNHWRCIVTSTTPVLPGNTLHTEASSITLVCFDTKLIAEPPPAPAKTPEPTKGTK
jgi:hypothetical protein